MTESLHQDAPSYEADNIGNLYELWNGESWPTGIRVSAWASRNDITHEEFIRHLRPLIDPSGEEWIRV